MHSFANTHYIIIQHSGNRSYMHIWDHYMQVFINESLYCPMCFLASWTYLVWTLSEVRNVHWRSLTGDQSTLHPGAKELWGIWPLPFGIILHLWGPFKLKLIQQKRALWPISRSRNVPVQHERSRKNISTCPSYESQQPNKKKQKTQHI